MYKPKVNLEQKEQKKEAFTDIVMESFFDQQNTIINLLEKLEEILGENERLVEENEKLKNEKVKIEDDGYIKMPEFNVPDGLFDHSTKLTDPIWWTSLSPFPTYKINN